MLRQAFPPCPAPSFVPDALPRFHAAAAASRRASGIATAPSMSRLPSSVPTLPDLPRNLRHLKNHQVASDGHASRTARTVYW